MTMSFAKVYMVKIGIADAGYWIGLEMGEKEEDAMSVYWQKTRTYIHIADCRYTFLGVLRFSPVAGILAPVSRGSFPRADIRWAQCIAHDDV